MPERPLKILLDHGIFTHSEFSEWCVQHTKQRWGTREVTVPITGIRRKPPQQNLDYEENICALFTVGRLIREGRIEAYDYIEIQSERFRGRNDSGVCNALQGCSVNYCQPPVHRSKFRSTKNFAESISKGGKKDRKRNPEVGEFTQVAFFEWLCSLSQPDVECLINFNPFALRHAPMRALTQFEVDSLKDLEWFKFVCSRSGSSENYPDVFHIWTAERNRLDVFLTLDVKLTNLFARIRNEKKKTISLCTEVLRPLELLGKLGIINPDPVPLEHNRFYCLNEVLK